MNSLKGFSMLSSQREYDIIIAGGGISGVAVAYGLISKNSQLKIAVLDSPTETDRASRTNVGLVRNTGSCVF